MFPFKRKKVEEVEEVENNFKEKIPNTKIKDLSPQNKRRRKEPRKPWGKKERFWVAIALGLTILFPIFLTIYSHGFKIKLPQINLPSLNQTIVVKNTNIPSPHPVTLKTVESKNTKEVITSVNNLTANLSGTYGLWVEELDGKKLSYGINENESFEGASLFKLPLLIAVYRGIESGKVNKDSVDDALFRLAKNSDNGAFVTLSGIVGYPAIRQAIVDADMDNTSLNDSVMTPHDVGNFFKNLMANKLVSKDSRDEILDLLTNTSFEFLIPQGIPDVRVAHKVGEEVQVLNDAGVVFAEKPFILIIMSKDIDEGEAEDNIPEIANIVYNFEK